MDDRRPAARAPAAGFSGPLILGFVFVVSTCGLVFELISGTVASYLLGDSVTQFSTVIGVYLFAMGVGSYLSKFVTRSIATVFVRIELLLGLVGGFSSALLFVLFEHVSSFRSLLYGLIGLIGLLVGVEIPLLMRLLKRRCASVELRDLISNVFTFDYVGALLASLLFPLVLVPYLGLIRSSVMFGALNVLVALTTLRFFPDEVRWPRTLRLAAFAVLVMLGLGFGFADKLMTVAEVGAFQDPVIFAKQTRYQRVVLTKNHRDLRLYLNGNLQFSSRDEYRYHEALVHMGLATRARPASVLVLGGGDGLAIREILKYDSVQSVTLVDLDPFMTKLFSTNDELVGLNRGAFLSPKVHVVNADAFVWLRASTAAFDFVVLDFPDPSNYSLGKLYSTAFFRLVAKALADDGLAVIQSTSPLVARKSFWCVDATLQQAGLLTTPYHALVPSFGEWGFVLAGKKPFTPPTAFVPGLRFMDAATARSMLEFPRDMARIATDVNKLNNQALVRYFDEEWAEYLR